VGVAVVGDEHLAVGLHVLALAVLLGELAHFDLGKIPLDGLGEELLAGLVLRKRMRGGEKRESRTGNQRCFHESSPQSLSAAVARTKWRVRCAQSATRALNLNERDHDPVPLAVGAGTRRNETCAAGIPFSPAGTAAWAHCARQIMSDELSA